MGDRPACEPNRRCWFRCWWHYQGRGDGNCPTALVQFCFLKLRRVSCCCSSGFPRSIALSSFSSTWRLWLSSMQFRFLQHCSVSLTLGVQRHSLAPERLFFFYCTCRPKDF